MRVMSFKGRVRLVRNQNDDGCGRVRFGRVVKRGDD